MLDLDTGVVALVAEGRADLTVLDFVVAVVAATKPHLHAFDTGDRVAVFAAHVDTLAVEIDERCIVRAVIMIVVVYIVAGQGTAQRRAAFEFMAVARQTVSIRKIGVRHPQIALLAYPRRTQRADAAFGERAIDRGPSETVDLVVVGIAIGAFGTQGEVVARPHGHAEGRRALVGHGIATHRGKTLERAVGHLLGDLAIDHVDDATNRATAVKQRRRPAQYFDSLREQRVHGNRMVGRYGRGIEQRRTIGKYAHTRRRLTANHGPARTGAECIGMHARQAVQRVTQRCGTALEKCLAFEQIERCRRIRGIGTQR